MWRDNKMNEKEEEKKKPKLSKILEFGIHNNWVFNLPVNCVDFSSAFHFEANTYIHTKDSSSAKRKKKTKAKMKRGRKIKWIISCVVLKIYIIFSLLNVEVYTVIVHYIF